MKLSRRHFTSLLLGAPILDMLAHPLAERGSRSLAKGVTPPANGRDDHPVEENRITVMRTPEGGIQPQAVVDRHGVLHLIYFKGDPSAGDVFYVHREPRTSRFSKPLRVNSQSGSVVALGSVRGAEIAVGKGGRAHVAWFGSAKARPRGPRNATPMLYTRLNDARTTFEPPRNVMQYATGLDGGGSVAADEFGNVYVAWHANPQADGEAHRQVYLARSSDEGKSFSREAPAYGEPTGACGCCGMRAFADDRANLYILYRTATEHIHRDMELLTSQNRGRTFSGKRIANWTLDACPMSTDFLTQGGRRVLAAWETAEQVYYAPISPRALQISSSVAAPGRGDNRKHPCVAASAQGETLLAWTEGTAWQKGGSVAWQLFDRTSRPVGRLGHADGLPVWGLVAALAWPEDEFTIFY